MPCTRLIALPRGMMDSQNHALPFRMAVTTQKTLRRTTLRRPGCREIDGVEPVDQSRRPRPDPLGLRHVVPQPHSTREDVRWAQRFQSRVKRSGCHFPHLFGRRRIMSVSDTALDIVAEREGHEEPDPLSRCVSRRVWFENRAHDFCEERIAAFFTVFADYAGRGLAVPAVPAFRVPVMGFSENQEIGRQAEVIYLAVAFSLPGTKFRLMPRQ